ncbi:MAG: Methionyl-tRNA synthetase [Parcubacteria group bacterium GW2011_GWB1_52_7]|nr:MAG: Methionyl-tRNA synthetase [Parcubacteria group bacterium GW2011_GWB1_52_7]KKW30098.1 MAG: Methionyl-tRNA synthetase [Parcubacteria group bacterium GW2011_GWC2_52_8c]
MPGKPYFITTPIYYVNDVPHIGHAYTTVAADVLARWKRSRGLDAKLLTGTDEHGAKIEEAAAQAGETPKVYADEIASAFRAEWDRLGIQPDRFIRTTDADHEETVRQFLQKMFDAGVITRGIYEGLYCVGHEKFMSPDELVGGKCPDHGKVPEPYKEENYFFKLSKFADELIRRIESDEIEVRPLERKNEVLGKLRQGLQDISISRAKLSWGIPLPFDSSHTAYVWVDALINYYTYGKPKGLWPADLHLIGKDILWFHSIIWPAMLLAIGEAPPRKIFAHGFFTIGGKKMSKTLGNVITPAELVKKYGVDGARYLVLSAFPFGTDGDFDWARLTEKYNADLANGIGNLHARLTRLAESSVGIVLGWDDELSEVRKFRDKYDAALEKLDFYQALQVIRELISKGDKLVNEKKPWALAGEAQKNELQKLLNILFAIAHFANPFMPETSGKILGSLGIAEINEFKKIGKAVLEVRKIENLFPRME